MNLVFIRKYDNYYYMYGDRVYELNDGTFENLKNKIYLPLSIHFKDCPIEFVFKISESLFDKTVDIEAKKVSNDQNPEVSDYDVTITEILSKSF